MKTPKKKLTLPEYCQCLEDLTAKGETIDAIGLQKWIEEYAQCANNAHTTSSKEKVMKVLDVLLVPHWVGGKEEAATAIYNLSCAKSAQVGVSEEEIIDVLNDYTNTKQDWIKSAHGKKQLLIDPMDYHKIAEHLQSPQPKGEALNKLKRSDNPIVKKAERFWNAYHTNLLHTDYTITVQNAWKLMAEFAEEYAAGLPPTPEEKGGEGCPKCKAGTKDQIGNMYVCPHCGTAVP